MSVVVQVVSLAFLFYLFYFFKIHVLEYKEHHSNNKQARRDLVGVDDVITPSERTHISETVVTYGLD